MNEAEIKSVEIYTDGGCSGNPGPGGWAAILIFKGREKEITGFKPETTNNAMELTAAIEGLKSLKERCSVKLHSDSGYLINAFEKGWIDKWMKNGWKTASKDPVKNKELWQELDELNKFHDIKWIKVKGHADNKYNNKCDELAVAETKKNRD